jgi:large conductance mechanosensitive channel
MFKEFREFAARGNVIDLAVGVIIGVAFGKIVASVVNDLVMPPVGMLLGGVDFTNFFIALDGMTYASLAAAQEAAAPTLNYGRFLNTVIEFAIVAFAVFLIVKQVSRLKSAPPPPAADTRECPFCVSTISLKASKCPHCTSPVGVSAV